ncbi:MAG: hypothetical protein MUE99_11895 [Chitinophagaceae bacterium]|nr:hypothetical protein [Chitinophagaceae bacterium]
MKKGYFFLFLVFVTLAAFFFGCSEKKIEFDTPPLSDYFPLQVGKYITYRLDSTVLTQFGRDTTVRSYRARDIVEGQITDGEGRTSYRIVRSLSNLTGTATFVPSSTFEATPENTDWIEYVENNLRFMKLRFPIIEGFEWKGNSFIDVSSINSSVRYLADWTYVYQDVGQPATINGITYPNTITVLQRDEVEPPGPFNPQFFKQYDYSIEIYALGIGLVYKNFDHKIWQPPTPPPDSRPGYWEDGSYRIILSAIDHN